VCKIDCVTYCVLKKIEVDMSDAFLRKGIFHVDMVKENTRVGIEKIRGDCENFQLIPKEEENNYFSKTLPLGQKHGEKMVLPKFIEFPPLMKLMLVNELKDRGIGANPDEVKLPLLIRESRIHNLVQE
jgi:hypothetical protein